MAKDKDHQFPGEAQKIRCRDFRGLNTLTTDCRCAAGESIVNPWSALASVENWGEEHATPDGVPDGDTVDPKGKFIPVDELSATDQYGYPLYLFEAEEEYVDGECPNGPGCFCILCYEHRPDPKNKKKAYQGRSNFKIRPGPTTYFFKKAIRQL